MVDDMIFIYVVLYDSDESIRCIDIMKLVDNENSMVEARPMICTVVLFSLMGVDIIASSCSTACSMQHVKITFCLNLLTFDPRCPYCANLKYLIGLFVFDKLYNIIHQ